MDKKYEFQTVEQFVARVGRQRLQTFLDKHTALMGRAIKENVFPDGWYWKIKDFCLAAGVEAPVNLFRSHPDNRAVVDVKSAPPREVRSEAARPRP